MVIGVDMAGGWDYQFHDMLGSKLSYLQHMDIGDTFIYPSTTIIAQLYSYLPVKLCDV